jgi:hypothetical protein
LRPSLGASDSRNTINENKKMKALANYDFNKDFTSKMTFEESLMQELANDFGESVSAPMAQVLISEFKKFVFLCQMNFEECVKAEVIYTYPLYNKDVKGTGYMAITPPPAIDTVWRAIIKYDSVYENFCQGILGGILDRKEPSESNQHVHQDYARTHELLKKYKDTVKPFPLLWPELSYDQYETEYNRIVSVSKKTLEGLSKMIDSSTKIRIELTTKNFIAF